MSSTVTEWIHVIITAYLSVGGFLPAPLTYVYISSVIILSWIVIGTCPLNIGMDYPNQSFTEELIGPGGLWLFMRFFVVNNLFASYRTGTIINILILILHRLKESPRYYIT